MPLLRSVSSKPEQVALTYPEKKRVDVSRRPFCILVIADLSTANLVQDRRRASLLSVVLAPKGFKRIDQTIG